MDLKTYEQIKFDLAEIIRAGQLIISEREKDANKKYDAEQPWRKLLTRLAEDRFTVVVAGRFSRGKSSLMNAVLGLDRLPTGIVPLTSVITYVRYGTSERVLLNYEGRGMRGETTLQQLPEYVTEKGNPGNTKGIHSAEIQLPAEILRRGFFFVDTPGLGSAIFENTKTTEKFIPEIDVLILVTSYESPLTEDEMRFLRYASGSVRAIFIVINKQDTVPAEAREEVVQYVERTARSIVGEKAFQIFSVSARDGLLAKQSANAKRLHQSGLAEFEAALVEFLANNRAELFLTSMFDRTFAELRSLPEQEAGDLFLTLYEVRKKIDPNSSIKSETLNQTFLESQVGVEIHSEDVSTCEVCKAVMKSTMKFLAQYQYELSTQSEVQQRHANNGGFCPLHTWHYEQIASPRGVCTAYPTLLNRMANRLQSLAADVEEKCTFSSPLLKFHCPVCEVRWRSEDQAIISILEASEQAVDPTTLKLSPLCLPHLQLILQRTKDEALRKFLLLREAGLMERVAEDMQRYAIKHDALRRDLASREENNSYLQALQMLVGHRNVNAIFTVRDIL